MISPIDKIDALLAGISKANIVGMPPANRRRLAQALRHVADLADPPQRPEPPRSGILADLKSGARTE